MLWKYARHVVTRDNYVNIISISARDFCLSGSVDSLQLFRHVLVETAGKREQVLCAVVAVQLIFRDMLERRNDNRYIYYALCESAEVCSAEFEICVLFGCSFQRLSSSQGCCVHITNRFFRFGQPHRVSSINGWTVWL